MVNLTLAIPTWRRYNFLEKVLEQYLENPLIQKLVICDETGEDVEAIRKATTDLYEAMNPITGKKYEAEEKAKKESDIVDAEATETV